MKKAEARIRAGEANIGVFYKKRIKLPYDVRRCAAGILKSEGAERSGLNIVFVGDGFIKRMNSEYRGKNRATDVITFQNSGKGGDIYISVDTAKRNAREFGVPVFEEVSRLVIHGVLHSLGYVHTNSRDERKMKSKAAKYMRYFKNAPAEAGNAE